MRMYIYVVLLLQLLGTIGSLRDLIKNNYPRQRSSVPAAFDWVAVLMGLSLFIWGLHLVAFSAD